MMLPSPNTWYSSRFCFGRELRVKEKERYGKRGRRRVNARPQGELLFGFGHWRVPILIKLYG